jgi:hypothetical protein
VLGWLLVAALALVLFVVASAVALAVGQAVVHGWCVVRDVRAWDTERPQRSAWRKVSGQQLLVTVDRATGMMTAQLAGQQDQSVMMGTQHAAEWLRRGSWRRVR